MFINVAGEYDARRRLQHSSVATAAQNIIIIIIAVLFCLQMY